MTTVTAANRLPPEGKFQFLKRGEGTARFGKLGKPPPLPPPIPLRLRRVADSSGGFLLHSAETKHQLMAGAEESRNPTSGGGSDSGCEDTPFSASDRGYHPSPQSVSLSETTQFETLEKDVGDSSISTDSTCYQQFISSVHKFHDRRKSSPRVEEVPEEADHGTKPTTGVLSPLARDREEFRSSHHPKVQHNGVITTTETSNANGSKPEILPPPIIAGTSSGSRVTRPVIPETSTVPVRPLGSFLPPPPLFSAPRPVSAGPVRFSAPPETHFPEVNTLIGMLRGRLGLLDQDFAEFKEKEKDAMERFEVQKLSLLQYERELDERKKQLASERDELDKFKAQQLADIKTAKEALEKHKKIVDKKESEHIMILKEQIIDLQNDICERDSKCSSQRAKIRQLELSLSKQSAETKEAKLEAERLNERTRTLEDTNAQLRLKLASQNKHGSVAPKTPDSVGNGRKTVRFDFLPTREKDREEFFRTDNQGTQTSFLTPAAPSGSEEKQLPFKDKEDSPEYLKDVDRALPDGSRETIFRNGTTRLYAADGQTVTYRYRNGDSRRILPDGTEIYCYSDRGVTQVTEPSGERVVRFPDGREERHLPDGTKKLRAGDVETVTSPDGQRVENYSDGTRLVQQSDGVTIVYLKDGSKETRSKDFTMREWPNGDVNIVHADGTIESRYASGRVRIKDSQGKVLRDEYIPE